MGPDSARSCQSMAPPDVCSSQRLNFGKKSGGFPGTVLYITTIHTPIMNSTVPDGTLS